MIPLFNFMIAEGDKKDKQRTDPAIHKTEKAKKKRTRQRAMFAGASPTIFAAEVLNF